MAFTKGAPFWPRIAATASLVLLGLPGLVPCRILCSAVSPGSDPQRLRRFELGVTCWVAWAPVSLWAPLDSSKWLRTLGMAVDPLGSYGFSGIRLGVLNIGASFLVLVKASSSWNRWSSIFKCRMHRGSSPEALTTRLGVEGQCTKRASHLSSLIDNDLASTDA
jgi:hypothetical protein